MEIFSLDELTLDLTKEEKETCKGLFFRVRKSSFMDSRGAICFNLHFVPLIRMSCKGCESCYYMYDDLRERNYDVDGGIGWRDDLKNGDTVELKVTNIHRDWESGYIDDWDLEFQKCD